VKKKDWETLWTGDELMNELNNNRMLTGFKVGQATLAEVKVGL